MSLWKWLRGPFGEKLPRVPVQCPYCANPDRNSVLGPDGFDRSTATWRGCQWIEDRRISIGADPPCLIDNYSQVNAHD